MKKFYANCNFRPLANLLVLALFVFIAKPAEATHFRGGTLTWQQAGGNNITFTVTSEWRFSYNWPRKFVGGKNDIGNINFGPGQGGTTMIATVTAIDPAADIIFMTWTFTKTYTTTGNFDVIALDECCRLSSLLNGNNDKSYSLKTVVNVGPPFNNPPVSGLPALINLPINAPAATFTVPAFDPDGDPLSFRLATLAESSGPSPIMVTQAPGGFSLSPSGVATMNTIGRIVGQKFALQIMIADGRSKTPVDLVIEMVGESDPPIFVSPSPANGTIFSVTPPGNIVSFTVAATDPDLGQSTILNSSSFPVGATMTPALPTASAPNGTATSTFNWTPTVGQVGSYILNFVAQDNVGIQTLHSITVNVLCALDVTVTAANGPSCPTLSDGNISITVQNASAPGNLVYTWTGPGGYTANTDNISGLASGNYRLRVDDIGTGCVKIIDVPIASLNSPPIITCPSDINVNNTPGQCGAIVNYPVATATGIPAPTITYSHPSGSLFPVGNTTVTATAINSCGTVSCDFIVTVNDVEPPTINCPAAITVGNDPGSCGAVVNYLISAADNCGNGGLETEYIVNGDFETGDLTGWTVSNTGSGTTVINNGSYNPSGPAGALAPISGSYDVITQQNNPTLHLMSQPFLVPAVVSNATVSWDDRIRNYNGSFLDPGQEFKVEILNASMIPVYEIFSTNPGDPYLQVGPNNRSFDITSVLQSLSGQMVCIRFTNDVTQDFQTVTLDNISLKMGGIQQTGGIASGGFFPIGVTTNTFTVSDAAGNTATCSFDVTVNDTEAPTIACPADITVSNDPGVCGGVVNFPPVTATDNCNCTPESIPGYTYYGTFGGHTYFRSDALVEWSVANTAANALGGHLATVTSAAENAFLTNNVLTWIGLTDQVTEGDFRWVTGEPFAYSSWHPGEPNNNGGNENFVEINRGAPGNWNDLPPGYPRQYYVEFDCVNVSVAQIAGLPDGSTFPIGVTTNTFVATDGAGNTDTCSFTVTVEDNLPPTLLTKDISVSLDANGSASITPQDVIKVSEWVGYLNAFDLPVDGGQIYEQGVTPLADLKTTVDGNAGTVTLQPNFTKYVSGDPNYVNGAFGNKIIQSSTYVEEAGLVDQFFTFSGTVVSNTLAPGYENYAFVRLFDATFNLLYEVRDPLVAGNNFRVSYDNTPANTVYVQYGFTVEGLNANPADEVALGSAVVQAITTLSDNCGPETSVVSPDAFNCSNVGSNTVNVQITDANGNTRTGTATVTVKDEIPPTITCVGNQIISTDTGECTYTTVGTAFDPAAFADNCSGSTIMNDYNGQSSLAGAIFPKGTTTVVWTVTDASNNTATCSFTVTVKDTENPTITCVGDQIKLTNPGLCTYETPGTIFDATAADNCPGVTLSYTLSGATTGSGNTTLQGVLFTRGTTTVTWTATDASGNTDTCSFTVTVNDDQNATDYIIYVQKEAKFGELNYIGGDVGVTDPKGKAHFKKYSVLDPYKVRAYDIKVDKNATVTNQVFSPANDGPAPAFMLYNGNTGGLNNIDINTSGSYPGNYDKVKVKKGVTATLTGNNFGKIEIEEGATVTFTATDINMEELKVKDGKKNVNLTSVIFSNPASVRVKDKVSIEDDTRVNVNGPKVTFYVGDNMGGSDNFDVKGDNSQVTANIMIPKGKLHVHGGKYGPTIMTGWYIVEKLESHEKDVYWNRYNCGTPVAPMFTEVKQPTILTIPSPGEFEVKLYPNPTSSAFTVQVISASNEEIHARIIDSRGTVIQSTKTITKQGLMNLKRSLPGGLYFVEVTQGGNRRVEKLLKVN